MPQGNKAYVVINDVSNGTVGAEFGFAGFRYLVLQPDNTIAVIGTVGAAPFSYGDSNQAIRESVASAIRDAVSDQDLDVNFVTG